MNPPPDQRLFARLVRALLRRDLRAAFRRVCWVGPVPDLPEGAPVILYANHHYYHDGHLLWLAATKLLGRTVTLWMSDWDRFPFFAAAGAQPFPPGEPKRRAATLLRTARRFRQDPQTALLYFPEGHLHAPEEWLLPFPDAAFRRLGRVLPTACWCPVALHVTWWGEARPTALLAAGAPHNAAPGDERERLLTRWEALRSRTAPPSRLLLEGRRSGSERWNFAFARSLFERYL